MCVTDFHSSPRLLYLPRLLQSLSTTHAEMKLKNNNNNNDDDDDGGTSSNSDGGVG